jgi:hypothetical protein
MASGLGTDSVTTSSARILGTVDPHGAPTAVSEAFGSNGFGSPSDLGSADGGPSLLAKTLNGLSAGTTYTFHFLMRNVNGHTTSAASSFTTASDATPKTVGATPTQATVALKCALKVACKGALTISLPAAKPRSVTPQALRAGLTLAKASYTITAKHTKKLKLTFTRKGRAALKHKAHIAIILTLRERDAHGHIHTTLHTATLRIHKH